MRDPRWDQIFIPGGKGGIPPPKAGSRPGILGGIAGILPISRLTFYLGVHTFSHILFSLCGFFFNSSNFKGKVDMERT